MSTGLDLHLTDVRFVRDVPRAAAPEAGRGLPAVRCGVPVLVQPLTADGVVARLLVVRHAEGRDLGAEPAPGAGVRVMSGRVGDAAPATPNRAPQWSPTGSRRTSRHCTATTPTSESSAPRQSCPAHIGSLRCPCVSASCRERTNARSSHLQGYLNKFVYRFSRRASRHRGLPFDAPRRRPRPRPLPRTRHQAAPQEEAALPPGSHGHPPHAERPPAGRPRPTMADLRCHPFARAKTRGIGQTSVG